VGRALALLELRVLLAAIVQRFDIRFADGFTQKEWLDGLKDRFALVTESRLLVVVTRRSTSSA
jgi:cytochrome P450